jgi:alanine racemase
VLLLGEGVSAEEIAAWSGTIAYDILCGIRSCGPAVLRGRRE